MGRIIGAAILYEEERRFLRRWLAAMYELCDVLVVVDDGSTDRTAELCSEAGAVVVRREHAEPWDEAPVRAALWDAVRGVGRPGDWVAVLDADEVPTPELLRVRSRIAALPASVERLDSRLLEEWAPGLHRADGLWSPWLPWLVRWRDEPFLAPGDSGRPLHGSRLPAYAALLEPHPLDLPILHLGYSRDDLRREKAAHYLARNDGVNLAHARTILDPPRLESVSRVTFVPKVQIEIPIRNRAWVVPALTRSLDALLHPRERIHVRFGVNDSTDETAALLRDWSSRSGAGFCEVVEETHDAPPADEHRWWGPPDDPNGPFRRMTALRNAMLRRLVESDADALLALDSDVLLDPRTIGHLWATGAAVVSPVLWAGWGMGNPGVMPEDDLPVLRRPDVARVLGRLRAGARPQVWERGQYELSQPFLADLALRRGVRRVGGLGAVTLIRREVAEAGVSYDPVYNLASDTRGEDRHFCVRAACAGFDLLATTYLPVVHCDGPEDVTRWDDEVWPPGTGWPGLDSDGDRRDEGVARLPG